MLEKSLEIINKLGLHARAAAKLVRLSSQFNANISVEYNARSANAKSIMSVMMLAAAIGSKIILRVEGDDEQQAFQAIEELINNRFDEEE